MNREQQLAIDLDFSTPVFHRENNPASQQHYELNADRFNKQCKKVYELLKEGKRLTVLDAIKNYNIGHLPRRILDLKRLGVAIKDEFVVDEDGNRTKFKEYFLNLTD